MEIKNKNKKKIVLVGPVYPFKGGISHYTGLLYRALNEKYDVKMISYRMQYPKILFRKEQRDYANDSFKVESTEYGIHTANPFNIISIGRNINKFKPDLIIIQWWHPYFSPCYYLLSKCTKAKILFTCHNVFPHERFPFDRFLTKLALKQGDFYVLHSKTEAEELISIDSKARYKINVHPTYNAFKFHDITKVDAKKRLEISEEDKVLLFFGFVRPYKGLVYLLQALEKLKKSKYKVKLLIVGDFGNKKEEYVQMIREFQIEDYIEIHDGYLPDKEVEKYFQASDLVVLPYESATQSGIVQIAYGFDRPVLVTNVGGLPEVVEDGKTGYIVEPKNPDALAEAIQKFYIENRDFTKEIKDAQYKFSWERMVETIEELQGW